MATNREILMKFISGQSEKFSNDLPSNQIGGITPFNIKDYYKKNDYSTPVRRPIEKDNTSVRNFNNASKHSFTARNKTDKEIAAERKARIDESVKYQNVPFTKDNWRKVLAKETQSTGDKFRASLEPNFFDDYLNPGVWVGSAASNLGQAPLQAERSDSYLPYVTSIGMPLAMGAFSGVGTKSVGQFANNLFNPLAGTKDILKTLAAPKKLLVDEHYFGPRQIDVVDDYKRTSLPSLGKIKEIEDNIKHGESWKYSGTDLSDEMSKLKNAAQLEKEVAYLNSLENNYDKYVGNNWTDVSKRGQDPVFLIGQKIEDLEKQIKAQPQGNQAVEIVPYKTASPDNKHTQYLMHEDDYIGDTKYRLPGGRFDSDAMLKDMSDDFSMYFNKQFKPFKPDFNNIPKNEFGGNISYEGYKRNSPDVNNDYNVIPSGRITMKDVDFNVLGIDNLGNRQVMKPGKEYEFPGDQVFEIPVFKKGGEMIRRADGSYSQRGLWDNIRANKGSGKKPTSDMLKQERKIRSQNKENGGIVNSSIQLALMLKDESHNNEQLSKAQFGGQEEHPALQSLRKINERKDTRINTPITKYDLNADAFIGPELKEVVVKGKPKGFWQQSFDKYTNEHKDDGLFGALGSVVTYPLQVSQDALMYGLTGKVQNPSRAMMSNNVVESALMDTMVDPTLLLTQLSKVPKLYREAKVATKNYLRPKAEYIDELLDRKMIPWGKDLPNELRVHYQPVRSGSLSLSDFGTISLRDKKNHDYAMLNLGRSSSDEIIPNYIQVDEALQGKHAQDVLYQAGIDEVKRQGYKGIRSGDHLISPEKTIKAHNRFDFFNHGHKGIGGVDIKTLLQHKDPNVIDNWLDMYKRLDKPKKKISMYDLGDKIADNKSGIGLTLTGVPTVGFMTDMIGIPMFNQNYTPYTLEWLRKQQKEKTYKTLSDLDYEK